MCRNVKRWRNETMACRDGVGPIEAERRFPSGTRLSSNTLLQKALNQEIDKKTDVA
jgi:hypothetical protein